MSRGGRGRGNNKSFSREQLSSLGVGNNEGLPGPVTQPPPLFPILDHKPIELNISIETKYLARLKEDFIDNLRSSPAYIKLSVKEDTHERRDIDKINTLMAQVPHGRNSFNWTMFPSELRPKLLAKKVKKTPATTVKIKTEKNIEEHLEKLENLEKTAPLQVVKQEVVEEEEEAEAMNEDDEEDEEMDDGTDYANNYFDNGEGYEDEDDGLEDGPCY